MFKHTIIALAIASITACSQDANVESPLTGKELAKKYIILDGHIDVPYRLENNWSDVTKATEGGDFDYPRAVAGGLNAPFMSIYIPAALELSGGSKELADKLIDSVEDIVNRAPDKFAIATSVADVKAQFEQGLISLPMGMENGSPIEGKMENLKHFYDRGVRYITLSHSKSNHISDSSYDPLRPSKGLTDFGKDLVVEMNNMGMLIDVSHISDDAFYQVMDITNVPVIASHSSARKFTPGFERNMDDEMLKRLKENGGVIQINYGSTFISQESRAYYDQYSADEKQFAIDNAAVPDSEIMKEFKKSYRDTRPFPFATLEDVLDHIDHVVEVAGIEHVGIGSDYDGVGDSLPTGLKDVASYPNLIDGLLARGYSEQDIEKILSGNVLRVWQIAEDYASSH
ncbi:dipeptidase [Thalassotalea crassostreae]|uniref:dipeptidase n=1 Tax=Thalassotalea crassostreae TaxID=1763536 RepID=UPI000837DDAF|nr:dipeptidase [Thalassotalea crassostreae]